MYKSIAYGKVKTCLTVIWSYRSKEIAKKLTQTSKQNNFVNQTYYYMEELHKTFICSKKKVKNCLKKTGKKKPD